MIHLIKKRLLKQRKKSAGITAHYVQFSSTMVGITIISIVVIFLAQYRVYAVSDWIERTSAGARTWSGINSSADGTKLVATYYSLTGPGYIYTSSDSGATWIQRTTAGNRYWSKPVISSDGTKLAAVAGGGGEYIYTSSDGGATWIQRTSAGARPWVSLTSSADGIKLAAGTNGGYIYTSSDGGATWTERTTAGGRGWQSITSSSDGTKLATYSNSDVSGLLGYIYTSSDSGATWIQRTSAGARPWTSIASSADGTELVATDSYTLTSNVGYIYTSSDGGATWTERSSAGARYWSSITSSADGTRLAAATYGDYIYTSTDGGATWKAESSGQRGWQSITSSSDGTKLAAIDFYGPSNTGGYIYTYGPSPSFIDIGLRVKEENITTPTPIAIEPIGTMPMSTLRIAKDGTTYGVALVPVDHPDATTALIKLASSGDIKALRRFTDSNTCQVTSAPTAEIHSSSFTNYTISGNSVTFNNVPSDYHATETLSLNRNTYEPGDPILITHNITSGYGNSAPSNPVSNTFSVLPYAGGQGQGINYSGSGGPIYFPNSVNNYSFTPNPPLTPGSYRIKTTFGQGSGFGFGPMGSVYVDFCVSN